MRHLLYIYNPLAGRQRARATLAEVTEIFSRQGYEVTVHPTSRSGDAAETAAREGGGFDRIVCCGGDGTLNEVVRGLLSLPEDKRPTVGYIPTGTTNDFSRTLGLPKSTDKLAELAGSGAPRAVDVGDAAGRPFTYVAAFGLFTDVSYSTPQASKQVLGHLAYVLEGAGKLANVPSYHMTVTAPGRTVEGDFIYGMVGNTLSVGGIVSLPRQLVRLDDGRFEVLLIRQPKNIEDWQTILQPRTAEDWQALFERTDAPEDCAVVGFAAERVTFSCGQPVAWTVDGEFGGAQPVTEVKNLPRAVRIACGPEGGEPA